MSLKLKRSGVFLAGLVVIASALVAALVYGGGLIASTFLPEPKSDRLPD